jgi:hypothetical protein
MVLTLRDAPNRMMAPFRIFLDVNFSAGWIHLGWKKLLMIVPINNAIMDAPNNSPGITFPATQMLQLRKSRSEGPRQIRPVLWF